MSTDATLLTRMKDAGVPLEDAHWYQCVARPRKFTGVGDVPRMRNILRKVAQAYVPSRALH